MLIFLLFIYVSGHFFLWHPSITVIYRYIFYVPMSLQVVGDHVSPEPPPPPCGPCLSLCQACQWQGPLPSLSPPLFRIILNLVLMTLQPLSFRVDTHNLQKIFIACISSETNAGCELNIIDILLICLFNLKISILMF